MLDWKNSWVNRIRGIVQYYNEKSYWSMRESVITHRGGVLDYYYLWRIKKWMHLIMLA